MDYKTFKSEAIKTESIPAEAVIDKNFLLNALSAAVGSSEVVDSIKKKVFYNKPLEVNYLLETIRNSIHNLNVLQNYINSYQTNPNALNGQLNVDVRTLHGTLGFYTEGAEVLSALFKAVTTDEPIDKVNLQEEIADAMWYTAILEDNNDIDLEDAMGKVINKLRARYPDKFTSDAAINRDLATERKILEGESIPTEPSNTSPKGRKSAKK